METIEVEKRDYRSFLKHALEARTGRNPRYSMRAFARDLGFSAPRLCNIFAGKYGLSLSAAREIGSKLGLSESELQDFYDLVEASHARSRVHRSIAQQRLEARNKIKSASASVLTLAVPPARLEELKSLLNTWGVEILKF